MCTEVDLPPVRTCKEILRLQGIDPNTVNKVRSLDEQKGSLTKESCSKDIDSETMSMIRSAISTDCEHELIMQAKPVGKAFQIVVRKWLSGLGIKVLHSAGASNKKLRPHCAFEDNHFRIGSASIRWMICKAFVGGVGFFIDDCTIKQIQRYLDDPVLGSQHGAVLFQYGYSENFRRLWEEYGFDSKVTLLCFSTLKSAVKQANVK